MSKGSRLVIAIVALLFAWGCAVCAASPDRVQSPAVLYGLMAFCIAVALACTNSPSGILVRRVIAGGVTLLYMAYLVKEVVAPDPLALRNSGANPSLFNALRGLAYIGIPCAIYAWRGNDAIDWLRAKLATKPVDEQDKPPVITVTETDPSA